jgi:hypothetical protein
MPKRQSLLCLLPLCLALFSAGARAQNPELGDTGNNRVATPGRPADPFPASPRENRPTIHGRTDHDLVVGHFGVGVFGVLQLPSMGCEGGTPTGNTCNPNTGFNLDAPAIGARWWMDDFMAIEGAVGIGFQTGGSSTSTGGTTVDIDEPSFFGMALHAGLPLVFATTAHFAFELVPEMNIGFVTGSWNSPNGNNDIDLSGFLLELGARVGAEIQFGFIDIPQLSLQGTVGLRMRYEGRGASVGNSDFSNHRFTFGTTVQGEPWDIFTGNIAAIYYF